MTKNQKKVYQDAEVLREIFRSLKGRKFNLDCGHYAVLHIMATALHCVGLSKNKLAIA
jgi:hypothetical protein